MGVKMKPGSWKKLFEKYDGVQQDLDRVLRMQSGTILIWRWPQR